ncbi:MULTISPECIES: NADH-quinone oxidoreductase subunit C [unclassified Campylobacter]|uniref:NADH-quinone oxidoreductase subunit C n=1 Tax=unclassified Campylobacter TaxID=2593542 RepID=UPI0022E9C7AB|nr:MULTISPECIES: NADH-quinone oxidoreductase subunit C [unclassified Campylobacter]MDA3054468.1 NADH-quinone oxidoreductase subunit C [Campylobacter sp. VBCF_07 NA4]MDA3060746.1 NADH-quinone oxidoreductase subunit C [Campylobacter sp. VBCF_02 NA5]MDA3069987.1 NADH-quinone oxidoreductase subunit C [Campylobacter sp. VBCF_08 NA3]WBR54427.1 NADH-quinone oxidoreductase subunit C [Campylobacter sp. VBCF_01 NA2]
MRKYTPKGDKSAKNYYNDRFFVPKKSEKFDPKNSKFSDDFENLSNLAKFEILNAYVEFDTLVIYTKKDEILPVLQACKELGYEILCELSGVDFIAKSGGIEVFYQLLDIHRARRMRVKCFVKTGEYLPSATGIFKSANWAERELYDMMGVWIANHPNLGRILMPNDWFGHPLLKSYPLQGDEFAKWYEVDKIFGRENRELIGEENRDSAMVDDKDTFNFSRINHETPYGEARPSKASAQEYQESGGVRFIKKAKRGAHKIITERK